MEPDRGAAAEDPDLDALPDGVLVADHRGVVVRANTAAHGLLGQPVLRGRLLVDVMALQDHDGRDWAAVTAAYTGLPTRRQQVEQPWTLPDGTELLVTTGIVRRSPRDPVERVGVCLRSARARTRLDRERSDLIATMAHELRSPLTGVKGFTATLLARWDRFTDDQKRLVMESVHRDTDRLTRLIAELLEVARIDTGRLSLHPRPLDAVSALEQVVASVAAGTSREIRYHAEPGLPTVWGDPDRFAQVMTNLVENAIKHGDGLVRVEARARTGPVAEPSAPEEYVVVTVEDEGEGIADALRARVFTKYWRHGVRGGSGLGMYIAHGLVQAARGRITIGDAEGGGARIEVLWPVHPPPAVRESGSLPRRPAS